jgi:hypothetical protein
MNRSKQAVLALGGACLAYGAFAATASFSGSSSAVSKPASSDAIVVVSGGSTATTTTKGALTSAWAASSSAGGSLIKTMGKPGDMFSFGVQTHFSQGWSPTWLGLADQVGARSLRDTVTWAAVETKPGVYDFSIPAMQTLTKFCATDGKLILTIVAKNKLYDGGRAVYSDAGHTAYAKYVHALLDKFGGCVSAIEVGNEINSGDNLDYPAGTDEPRTYVATLRRLKQIVKPAYPGVTILGGSTNAVGTGFLEKLFAVGALDAMDGVAVHPYRGIAEGLDDEITHLRDVMRKYGNPVPIWATEFSYDTTDKAAAASGLVKSAALLNASGVDHASWYALVDQKWFPNMGLFTGTTIKPTGLAYQNIMQKLFAYGRATRVDTGDSLVYLYRFGTDRWLVWGAPRTLTFFGAPVIRDIYGKARTGARVEIGNEPIIVEQASGYSMSDSDVVADSMLQYGGGPWSYLRRGSDNKETGLSIFDNDFTSYMGDRWSKPLRINNNSAAPAGTGSNPIRAVVRYTSPKAQQLDLDACFSKEVSGDGVDYKILRNGVTAASGILTDKAVIRSLALDVAPGDKVDLIVGPNQTYGGDGFRYRLRLTARGRGAPLCS